MTCSCTCSNIACCVTIGQTIDCSNADVSTTSPLSNPTTLSMLVVGLTVLVVGSVLVLFAVLLVRRRRRAEHLRHSSTTLSEQTEDIDIASERRLNIAEVGGIAVDTRPLVGVTSSAAGTTAQTSGGAATANQLSASWTDVVVNVDSASATPVGDSHPRPSGRGSRARVRRTGSVGAPGAVGSTVDGNATPLQAAPRATALPKRRKRLPLPVSSNESTMSGYVNAQGVFVAVTRPVASSDIEPAAAPGGASGATASAIAGSSGAHRAGGAGYAAVDDGASDSDSGSSSSSSDDYGSDGGYDALAAKSIPTHQDTFVDGGYMRLRAGGQSSASALDNVDGFAEPGDTLVDGRVARALSHYATPAAESLSAALAAAVGISNRHTRRYPSSHRSSGVLALEAYSPAVQQKQKRLRGRDTSSVSSTTETVMQLQAMQHEQRQQQQSQLHVEQQSQQSQQRRQRRSSTGTRSVVVLGGDNSANVGNAVVAALQQQGVSAVLLPSDTTDSDGSIPVVQSRARSPRSSSRTRALLRSHNAATAAGADTRDGSTVSAGPYDPSSHVVVAHDSVSPSRQLLQRAMSDRDAASVVSGSGRPRSRSPRNQAGGGRSKSPSGLTPSTAAAPGSAIIAGASNILVSRLRARENSAMSRRSGVGEAGEPVVVVRGGDAIFPQPRFADTASVASSGDSELFRSSSRSGGRHGGGGGGGEDDDWDALQRVVKSAVKKTAMPKRLVHKAPKAGGVKPTVVRRARVASPVSSHGDGEVFIRRGSVSSTQQPQRRGMAAPHMSNATFASTTSDYDVMGLEF